jgi:hypothetical protein
LAACGASWGIIGGPPAACADRYRPLSPLAHISGRMAPMITVHGETGRNPVRPGGRGKEGVRAASTAQWPPTVRLLRFGGSHPEQARRPSAPGAVMAAGGCNAEFGDLVLIVDATTHGAAFAAGSPEN